MSESFSALAAYRPTGYNLSDTRRRTRTFDGETISAGFFEILGVRPILGQTFRREDDARGTAPVAMISESLS